MTIQRYRDIFISQNIHIPVYEIDYCKLTLPKNNNSEKLFKILNYGTDITNIHDQIYVRRQKINYNICLYLNKLTLGLKQSKLIEPIKVQMFLYQCEQDGKKYGQISGVYSKIFYPNKTQTDNVIMFQVDQSCFQQTQEIIQEKRNQTQNEQNLNYDDQNKVYLVVILNKLLSSESNEITHQLYQNVSNHEYKKPEGYNYDIDSYMQNNLYPIQLLGCTEKSKKKVKDEQREQNKEYYIDETDEDINQLKQDIVEYYSIVQQNEQFSKEQMVFQPFALSYVQINCQDLIKKQQNNQKLRLILQSVKYNQRQYYDRITEQIRSYLLDQTKNEKIDYVHLDIRCYIANSYEKDEKGQNILKQQIFDRVSIDNCPNHDLLYMEYKKDNQSIKTNFEKQLQYDSGCELKKEQYEPEKITAKEIFGLQYDIPVKEIFSLRNFNICEYKQDYGVITIESINLRQLLDQIYTYRVRVQVQQNKIPQKLLFDNDYKQYNEYVFTVIFRSGIIYCLDSINIDLNNINLNNTKLVFNIDKVLIRNNQIISNNINNFQNVYTSEVQLDKLIQKQEQKLDIYKSNREKTNMQINFKFRIFSNQRMQGKLKKLQEISSLAYNDINAQKQLFSEVKQYLYFVLKNNDRENVVQIIKYSKMVLYQIMYILKNHTKDEINKFIKDIFEIMKYIDLILQNNIENDYVNIDKQYKFYNIIYQCQNKSKQNDVYNIQYTGNQNNQYQMYYRRKFSQLGQKEQYLLEPDNIKQEIEQPRIIEANIFDILLNEVKMDILNYVNQDFLAEIIQKLQQVDLQQCFEQDYQEQQTIYMQLKQYMNYLKQYLRLLYMFQNQKLFDTKINIIEDPIQQMNIYYQHYNEQQENKSSQQQKFIKQVLEDISLLIVKCIDQSNQYQEKTKDIRINSELFFRRENTDEKINDNLAFPYLWYLIHSSSARNRDIQTYLLKIILYKLNEDTQKDYFSLLRDLMIKIYQFNDNIEFLQNNQLINQLLFDTVISYWQKQVKTIEKQEKQEKGAEQFYEKNPQIKGNLCLLCLCVFEICFKKLEVMMNYKNIIVFTQYLNKVFMFFQQKIKNISEIREQQNQPQKQVQKQKINNKNKDLYNDFKKRLFNLLQQKGQKFQQQQKNQVEQIGIQQDEDIDYGNDLIEDDITKCLFEQFKNFTNNLIKSNLQINEKIDYILLFQQNEFIKNQCITEFIKDLVSRDEVRTELKQNKKMDSLKYVAMIVEEILRGNDEEIQQQNDDNSQQKEKINKEQLFEIFNESLKNEQIVDYMIQYIQSISENLQTRNEEKQIKYKKIGKIFAEYQLYLNISQNEQDSQQELQNSLNKLQKQVENSTDLTKLDQNNDNIDEAEKNYLLFQDYLSYSKHYQRKIEKIQTIITNLSKYKDSDTTNMFLGFAYLLKALQMLQLLVDKEEYIKITQLIQPLTVPIEYIQFNTQAKDYRKQRQLIVQIFSLLNQVKIILYNNKYLDLYLIIQTLIDYLSVNLSVLQYQYQNYNTITQLYINPMQQIIEDRPNTYNISYQVVNILECPSINDQKQQFKEQTFLYVQYDKSTIPLSKFKNWHDKKNQNSQEYQYSTYVQTQSYDTFLKNYLKGEFKAKQYIVSQKSQKFIFKNTDEKCIDETFSLSKFIEKIIVQKNLPKINLKQLYYKSEQLFGNVFCADVSYYFKDQTEEDKSEENSKIYQLSKGQVQVMIITKYQLPCLLQRVQSYKIYICLTPIQTAMLETIKMLKQQENYQLQENIQIKYNQLTQFVSSMTIAQVQAGIITTIKYFDEQDKFKNQFEERFEQIKTKLQQNSNSLESSQQLQTELQPIPALYTATSQTTQTTTNINVQETFNLGDVLPDQNSKLVRIYEQNPQFYRYNYSYSHQLSQYYNVLTQAYQKCYETIQQIKELYEDLDQGYKTTIDQYIYKYNEILDILIDRSQIIQGSEENRKTLQKIKIPVQQNDILNNSSSKVTIEND